MTEQIAQLTEWITEDKRTIRMKSCKVLKEISSDVLATKLAQQILVIALDDKPLTAFAGGVGKSILMGIEDLTIPEKKINKKRIDVGLQLTRILLEKEIFHRYKSRVGRLEYRLTSLDEEFINAIFYGLPVNPLGTHTGPVFGRPNEITTFADKEGGQLVRRINYKHVAAYSKEAMPIVYDVVNKANNVPYLVNTELLNVYQSIQNDELFTYKELIAKMKKQGKSTDEIYDMVHGLTRDNNIVMSKACAIGGSLFYQYNYLDFRGRKYPAPHYLNHTGSKIAKSLLLLANKEEIGKEGWFWIRMHAANCWGEDKLPINERVDFTDNHLEEWMEMAANPIKDRRWTEADDPHCFLACILELKNALDSGDKYTYKSGLPVAFDAGCSGLMILAALSRDERAGALCNLVPNDIRGDYYLHIADYCWKDGGLPDIFAALFDDRRKIVKRSCMTYFYSCGPDTMGEHIYNDHGTKYGLTRKDCRTLGHLIYDYCRELMPGVTKIMDLFIEMGLHEADEDRDLVLRMPYDGFTVIQNYRNHEKAAIHFKIQGERLHLAYVGAYNKKIIRKDVKSGSSPNIVHALDAQLVSMIISMCDYDVMCIHDSFSAVPGNAGRLFEDTRRAFVELFREDVLTGLTDQLGLPNPIEYGTLDIEKIPENEYCFA